MVEFHRLPKLAAVTGGTGFIGAHVVRLLLEAGVRVRVFALENDPAELLEGLEVDIVRGDLESGQGFDALLDGADGLFHLAAIYALFLKDPDLMFRVNVEGTRKLLAAAKRHQITRVVYTSSIAAVSSRAGQTPADETCAFDPTEIDETYVLSKGASEQLALEASQEIDLVAVNPSFPVGPGDITPTPTGRLVRDVAQGRLPVRISGGLNLVDVRDVARGHLLAYERGRRGERYLLSGTNLSNDEFMGKIYAISGRSTPVIRLPDAVVHGAAMCLEAWARLTGISPMLTRASARYTVGKFLYFDNTKALQELGFTNRPAEETLRDAITWFDQRTG
jgi:dihydroflavonol-4-reductase